MQNARVCPKEFGKAGRAPFCNALSYDLNTNFHYPFQAEGAQIMGLAPSLVLYFLFSLSLKRHYCILETFIKDNLSYPIMKYQKSYTIDEELIKFIREEAQRQNRSESYVVNEILANHRSKISEVNGSPKASASSSVRSQKGVKKNE